VIRTPLTSAALITIFDPVADERELEVLTPLSASGRVASEIAATSSSLWTRSGPT
jgi:hypothetical protein